jgi:hypothetical protein
MTSDNIEFPSIRDQDGTRRGSTSTGPIDLPIANWAVSVVELSRFPILLLRFYPQDGPDPQARHGYFLRVEGSMVIVIKTVAQTIDPPQGGTAAYLELVFKTVRTAVASADGSLVVTFTDGDRLEVPRDGHYEPWLLSGDDGSLVVSNPGGGLSVWGPDPRKA